MYFACTAVQSKRSVPERVWEDKIGRLQKCKDVICKQTES